MILTDPQILVILVVTMLVAFVADCAKSVRWLRVCLVVLSLLFAVVVYQGWQF